MKGKFKKNGWQEDKGRKDYISTHFPLSMFVSDVVLLMAPGLKLFLSPGVWPLTSADTKS